MGGGGLLIDMNLKDGKVPIEELADKYIAEIDSMTNDEGKFAALAKKAIARAREYEIELCETTDRIYNEHIK